METNIHAKLLDEIHSSAFHITKTNLHPYLSKQILSSLTISLAALNDMALFKQMWLHQITPTETKLNGAFVFVLFQVKLGASTCVF